MDWQEGIGPLALIVAFANLYYQRKQTKMMETQVGPSLPAPVGITSKQWWKSPGIIALTVLVVLAWAPQIISYYKPPAMLVTDVGYGGSNRLPNGQIVLPVSGNLSALSQQYGNSRRIIAAALKFDGTTDMNDVSLLKSSPHDLHNGNDVFLIPTDPQFMQQIQNGIKQTYYFFIIFPRDLSPEQFVTLREVVSLKAAFIQIGAGPP